MGRERRPLASTEDAAESERFGCPMLAHIHSAHAVVKGVSDHRCHLGWALRTELDVARCRATNAVTDCWKAHPERAAVVALDEVSEPRTFSGSDHEQYRASAD